ncbi:TniQ family protein [Streptomyces hirsutus]|uniref:TniQ family protein n=1 Tax=Streptomyces hirsutus TaxID=35620 RepID=UPI0036413872
MPPLRPLARSLPPLPDESLPGFLLRLAFRLDTSPAELAVRTGLADRANLSVLPLPLLIGLTTERRHTFARMIKATDTEVDGMLLDIYSSRYPPARPSPSGRNGLANQQHRWLFMHATRYCPQCLAGQDNPVEQAFGGVWKNSWRLPPVFACLAHRRFLEHECPACKSAILPTTTRSTVRHLPRWREASLHPGQCRAFVDGQCEHRLDRGTANFQSLSAEYEEFQHFLLGLLNPVGPDEVNVLGHSTSPAHYFTDLRTACQILRASWPKSHHLLDNNQELISFLEAAANETPRSRSTLVHAVSDMPQLAAQSHAALLLSADRLLRASDLDTFAGHLRTLLDEPAVRPSKVSWARAFLTTRPQCSEGVLQAVSSVVQTYAGRSLGRSLKQPIRRTRFHPEHIPQFLEEDWYQRHFAHMDGIAMVHLRRTVAIRLCQAASGGSIQKAADHLSLYLSDPAVAARIADSPKRVHGWARKRPDPLEFEISIRNLTAELDARNNLIDYAQRRKVLSSWCIGPTPWEVIASCIAVPAGGYAPGGGFAIDLSDRKRNIASVILWSLMTQGEHVFAPTPICDQQDPETQRKWRNSVDTVWARMRHGTTRPTDTQMITALEEYAAYLAPIVDRGETPSIAASPWT